VELQVARTSAAAEDGGADGGETMVAGGGECCLWPWCVDGPAREPRVLRGRRACRTRSSIAFLVVAIIYIARVYSETMSVCC
jgi:hypothetical protein